MTKRNERHTRLHNNDCNVDLDKKKKKKMKKCTHLMKVFFVYNSRTSGNQEKKEGREEGEKGRPEQLAYFLVELISSAGMVRSSQKKNVRSGGGQALFVLNTQRKIAYTQEIETI